MLSPALDIPRKKAQLSGPRTLSVSRVLTFCQLISNLARMLSRPLRNLERLQRHYISPNPDAVARRQETVITVTWTTASAIAGFRDGIAVARDLFAPAVACTNR